MRREYVAVACVVALSAAAISGCARPERQESGGGPAAKEAAKTAPEKGKPEPEAGRDPAAPALATLPVPGPAEPKEVRTVASEKPKEAKFEHKWFFAFGLRPNREGVDTIKGLIDTAADHGLNGMVLSSFGLDSITRWPADRLPLLKEVAEHCRAKRIELVPTGFSVGYGGGALGHDRSFAAALPSSIALVARGGRIVPVDGENLLANGGLEEHDGNSFKGYAFHDQPGEVSFADTEVKASGKASIRFEKLSANPHGHGRIMQRVAVEPGRSYRFSFKIRTDGLQPVSGIQALVLKEKGTMASYRPRLKSTQDWTEVTLDVINTGEKELRFYAGIWGGKSGRFWLDEMKVAEYGDLTDIVRREGTPLELKSAEREAVFVEGRDFAKVECRRDLKEVKLPAGTSIKDGERLRLSCYKIPYVRHSWGKQISLCMSNPELYEYWEAQARRLHEVLKYKRVLLSMDEIRNGGGCQLCSKSGKSMAEILGDCITKQREIFRKIDPEIEVYIWSDMLDPNHNAKNNYYGVIGDFTGSYKHVPKDLVIMCWWHKMREKSLAFFSGEGFRTFGACYYDADDLKNPKEWLESLKKTKDATGIMYTTWQRKYKLLADYGDLVSKK